MDEFYRKQLDDALADYFSVEPPLAGSKIEEEILDMTGSWNPVTRDQVLEYITPKIKARKIRF